jgi:hypothetical protein
MFSSMDGAHIKNKVLADNGADVSFAGSAM